MCVLRLMGGKRRPAGCDCKPPSRWEKRAPGRLSAAAAHITPHATGAAQRGQPQGLRWHRGGPPLKRAHHGKCCCPPKPPSLLTVQWQCPAATQGSTDGLLLLCATPKQTAPPPVASREGRPSPPSPTHALAGRPSPKRGTNARPSQLQPPPRRPLPAPRARRALGPRRNEARRGAGGGVGVLPVEARERPSPAPHQSISPCRGTPSPSSPLRSGRP